MNILQILPTLNIGGVETGTKDLSKELVKKGHKVIVVSNGGVMVTELIDAGMRHINLPVHRKSLFTVLKTIKKLELIIKEEDVDIVHARSRIPAIIAFFATRRTNANFITTAHGYYSTHFLSRIMGWGKFVIVASTVIGRHMMEDFGVPRERIRFIPRGVDLDKFKFSPIDPSSNKAEYKIGVVGRITAIKGHSFFLQAIARVVRIFPKVKILIVGEPPKDKPEYKEDLKRLVNRLHIERFVEFMGARQDIPKVMSELDLLVLPSVGKEAFGRVIIEAGASGVPVIATRTGGAVDIIENGKTGVLVIPGDIMEMVDSIISLLKDRNLSKNLALEAREKVEKEYTLSRMVEDTLKVYEDAVHKKRILVIKISAIGDVILAVPSLRVVRNNFPNAYISVLVGDEARGILKRCPYIDDIIIYDRKEKDRAVKGLMKIGALIRRSVFDMSIDLQNNTFSHIVAWLGAIPRRFGYNNKKMGFLINNKLEYLKIDESPVEQQFRVLKHSGIDTMSASKHLELWPSKEDFLYIDRFLENEWVGKGQILVGMNIGGSWKTKRWPLAYFVQLSDMLAKKDIRVVVTGSKEELDLAQDIIMNMSRAKIINAIGKTTLLQLAALIKRCKVFVTGDSSPMHIASSMGTNFIALFGPTDHRRHFEPTEKAVVISKEVRCSPCYRAHCKKLVCMEKISVEEVFGEVMGRITQGMTNVK